MILPATFREFLLILLCLLGFVVNQTQGGDTDELVSADDWLRTDETLKQDAFFKRDHAKYAVVPPESVVKKTVDALLSKGHVVKLFEHEADAVDYLKSLLAKDKSISFGGSTTLKQIGFLDYVKTRADIKNYKAESLILQQRGDPGNSIKTLLEGSLADFFFSSVR